ncbi:pirin family protein [Acidobacteriota bacterium]
MVEARKIKHVLETKPTTEGAGVHLHRAFGYNEVPLLDPFLLLDDFSSSSPSEYLPGFPWHPHRGIETVTYMLHGEVKHGDSIGSSGLIEGGDVQWMTAGSGIIHSEMPQEGDGSLAGFQLWANLPASQKMIPPRYQDVKGSEIPAICLDNSVKIRVVCGEVEGTRGPVGDIVIDPEYIDVTIPRQTIFKHPVKQGYKVFAYVFEGEGYFDLEKKNLFHSGQLVIFDDGDGVEITGGDRDVRFLLISGKPIGEPVAWYGPIVMNTGKELRVAFKEYQDGTFIKHKK